MDERQCPKENMRVWKKFKRYNIQEENFGTPEVDHFVYRNVKIALCSGILFKEKTDAIVINTLTGEMYNDFGI